MVSCLRSQPDLPGMFPRRRGTTSRARTLSWPYPLVSLSRRDLSALSLGASPMHPVDLRCLTPVDTQLDRQVGVVEYWLRSLVPFHPLECGMSPGHPAESRHLSLVYTHLRRWDSVVECWPRRLAFRTFLTHLADPRHPSLVEMQPRRWQHSVDSWLHPPAFSLSLSLPEDCEHRPSGLRPRSLSRTHSWSNGVSVLPHTGQLPQPTAVALRRTRVIPHPLMAARREVISQCSARSLPHNMCRPRALQPVRPRRLALPELEAPARKPDRREWWRSRGTFWEFRGPGGTVSTRLGGSRASQRRNTSRT